MAKLSKSRPAGLLGEATDGTQLTLERYGPPPGTLLLSVRHADDETWRCYDTSVEELERMAAWARRTSEG